MFFYFSNNVPKTCSCWLKISRNIEIKYLFHFKVCIYMLNTCHTSSINAFSLILILKYNLSSFFLSIHHSHMNKVHQLYECLWNTYLVFINKMKFYNNIFQRRFKKWLPKILRHHCSWPSVKYMKSKPSAYLKIVSISKKECR